MTQITITFDEKFDLEEGELRISRIDDIDNTYNFYWWENVDEDYTLISDFNIDNTGNVTQITYKYPYNTSNSYNQYWQFGYFVNDELVKSTKYIPMAELSENYTSGQSINIADVEKLVFILNDEIYDGIQYAYDEDTGEQIPGYVDIKINVYDVTKLYGYDDPSDYDLSDMLIQIYDTDGETPLRQVRFGDLENVYENFYRLDGDYPWVYIEFVSPGVVSNKAEISESS